MSLPFAAIVLIVLLIAAINIHPPLVLFMMFVLYGLSGYIVYAWRKAKGLPTSVISVSTDELDERDCIGEAVVEGMSSEIMFFYHKDTFFTDEL